MSRVAGGCVACVEGLEQRRLMSVGTAISNVVIMETSMGQIDLQLTPEATPITVANFLQYVTAGKYNQTLIHRATKVDPDGLQIIQGGGFGSNFSHIATFGTFVGNSTTSVTFASTTDDNGTITRSSGSFITEGFAVGQFISVSQSGIANDNLTAVISALTATEMTISQVQVADVSGVVTAETIADSTDLSIRAAIANEFDASRPNAPYTIAMAKVGPPPAIPPAPPNPPTRDTINSATSEWFFNVGDQSTILDGTNNGGFTVFGSVLRGRNVVDAISGLRIIDATGTNPAFVSIPVIGLQPVTVFEVTANNTILPVIIGDNGGGDRKAVYKDADGVTQIISLSGGTATLDFMGTNIAHTSKGGVITITGTNLKLNMISTTGTTAASSIKIDVIGTAAQGFGDVTHINTDASLGFVNAPRSNFVGSIATAGSLNRVKVFGLTGAKVTVGSGLASGRGLKLESIFTEDANLVSQTPVTSIKTSYWRSVNTASQVVAPSISSIFAPNEWGASLTVGTQAASGSVRSIKVGSVNASASWQIFGDVKTITAGDLTDGVEIALRGDLGPVKVRKNSAVIQARTVRSVQQTELTNATIVANGDTTTGVAGTIGSVKVTGDMSNATIRALTSVGSVSARSIGNHSKILAGVTDDVANGNTLPTTSAAFNTPGASIGSVTVKKIARAVTFSNTLIIAPVVGKVSLGLVETDNAGTAFGIAADTLASLSGLGTGGQNLTLKNLSTATQQVFEDFQVVIV